MRSRASGSPTSVGIESPSHVVRMQSPRHRLQEIQELSWIPGIHTHFWAVLVCVTWVSPHFEGPAPGQ